MMLRLWLPAFSPGKSGVPPLQLISNLWEDTLRHCKCLLIKYLTLECYHLLMSLPRIKHYNDISLSKSFPLLISDIKHQKCISLNLPWNAGQGFCFVLFCFGGVVVFKTWNCFWICVYKNGTELSILGNISFLPSSMLSSLKYSLIVSTRGNK